MRIARFLSGGRPVTGRLIDDRSAHVIEGDLFGQHRVIDQVAKVDRLLAPLVPTDILCIGLNYLEHAKESGSSIPENPMLFIKSSNTLAGPGDPILIPRRSTQIDYECELAVIIGKTAKHVPRARALDYVFGYTAANDVSSRDWQREKNLGGGQFARGKSFDTFCPLGPWIVTRDEIPQPERAAHQDHPQRPDDAGPHDRRHDLRRARPDRIPQQHDDPPPRQHHPHRHPAGRRLRADAASVAQAGRHRRHRNREDRPP
jgi:hypothetical protein